MRLTIFIQVVYILSTNLIMIILIYLMLFWNSETTFILVVIVSGKSLELPYGVGIVGMVGNELGRTQ